MYQLSQCLRKCVNTEKQTEKRAHHSDSNISNKERCMKRLKCVQQFNKNVNNVILPDDMIVKIVNYNTITITCTTFGMDVHGNMSRFEKFGTFYGIIHGDKFTCNVDAEWVEKLKAYEHWDQDEDFDSIFLKNNGEFYIVGMNENDESEDYDMFRLVYIGKFANQLIIPDSSHLCKKYKKMDSVYTFNAEFYANVPTDITDDNTFSKTAFLQCHSYYLK